MMLKGLGILTKQSPWFEPCSWCCVYSVQTVYTTLTSSIRLMKSHSKKLKLLQFEKF